MTAPKLSPAQRAVLIRLIDGPRMVRWSTASVLVPAGLITCTDQRLGTFVLTERGRSVAAELAEAQP